MSYFFEAVIDADGRLLGGELTVDIANKEGAFAYCRPSDDDGFVVFESCIFDLAHLLRNYYKSSAISSH